MKKRNMSLILVLALILCLIPATAFADNPTTWSGDITDNKTVTDTVTVDGTVNIKANVTVTTGKIIVPDGATLTISAGKYLWLNSTNATLLEIEDGGELVVNGEIWSNDDLSNVKLLGKMIVKGDVYINYNNPATTFKIGGNSRSGDSRYQMLLDSAAEVTVTSLGDGSRADGYKYVISGGTATTNNFTNSGKDELVVASGAVLDATNGLTLNSAEGASTNQLTVQDGGKLIASADTLAATFGMASPAQDEITSGTYTADPSAYKADGYKVVQNEAKTEWTVTPKGYLSKIAVVVKEPVVGETPATTYTSTVKADGSATASEKAYWFKIAKADYDTTKDIDEQKWGEPIEEEKFQKDYYYMFATYFVTEDGYEAKDLAVTVNGKKADFVDSEVEEGTTYVEVYKVFGPLAEKSPVTGDNNELGLFAVAGLISALGVALMLRREHSM